MGFFAQATQEALDRGDEMTVRAHIDYAEELLRRARPELENAMQVSYLEFIAFDKAYPNRLRPRQLLPSLLRESPKDLEEHLRRICGQSNE